MKILLVHGYFLDLDPNEKQVMKPYPPLGILYLSAWLKQQNYEVEVFDGTFANDEGFRRSLSRFEPQVVGFYANMMTRRHVLRLRSYIESPEVRVVVGGPDPPHYAEEYLDCGFEVVMVGEGEQVFTRWLAAMDQPQQWQGIEGLIYRDEDGYLKRTAPQKNRTPLDDYPFPDRGAIELEQYLDCWETHHGQRPVSLISSRGCPFQCTWCSHNVFGYSLRKRSPENVMAEFEWLHRNYRLDHYWFADDVFTIKFDWVFALRDLLRQEPRFILPFECISRADRLNPDIVDALAEMRAHRVWVGAESGSQRLLNLMKRGIKRDQVITAVKQLRAAGIGTGMFFMWGFMDETLADVQDTVSLVTACEPDIALTTLAYPIRGTKFYNQLEKQGRLGEMPLFDKGSDRDITILGQANHQVYAHANRMLHAALGERRNLRLGPRGLTRAMAHRAKKHLAAYRLRRAFAAHSAANETASVAGPS